MKDILSCATFNPARSKSGTIIFLKYFLLVVRTVIVLSSSAVTLYTFCGYGKFLMRHSSAVFVILLVINGYYKDIYNSDYYSLYFEKFKHVFRLNR